MEQSPELRPNTIFFFTHSLFFIRIPIAIDDSPCKMVDASVGMSIADPHISPPESPPYFHTLTPPASPSQLETLRLHPKRMLSMSHSAPNIAALVKATKPGKVTGHVGNRSYIM